MRKLLWLVIFLLGLATCYLSFIDYRYQASKPDPAPLENLIYEDIPGDGLKLIRMYPKDILIFGEPPNTTKLFYNAAFGASAIRINDDLREHYDLRYEPQRSAGANSWGWAAGENEEGRPFVDISFPETWKHNHIPATDLRDQFPFNTFPFNLFVRRR